MPHEDVDWDGNGSHSPVAPPLQQPFGQLFSSHSHKPLAVSQRPLEHALHARPPNPQSIADCDAYGTHWPPALQHPPAQVDGPQGPASPPLPGASPASSPVLSPSPATSAIVPLAPASFGAGP